MAPREAHVRFEDHNRDALLSRRTVEAARAYLKREIVVGYIRDEILRAPATARPVDIATYVLREVDQALHALQFAHEITQVPRYAYGIDESATATYAAWSVTDTRDGSIAAIYTERCPDGVTADAVNRVRNLASLQCMRLNEAVAGSDPDL